MTTLIIARHGNTFAPGDTPTRVGKRTDLPLVESGIEQARKLGLYLQEHDLLPDIAYTSTLKRTQETAHIAVNEVKHFCPFETSEIFDEIDYGPDENKTEDDVIKRIGAQAVQDWDSHGIVPDGWDVDPEKCRADWADFAHRMNALHHKKILVVTSNGIARFAPALAGNFEKFCASNTIKLSTGALGILHFGGTLWHIDRWNVRP